MSDARPAYGLPEILTEQSLFDRVATHLFTQGRPALTADGKCAYRGMNGTACAVGCVISDDRYHPEMEERSVFSGVILEKMPELKSLVELMSRLQAVHDAKHNRLDVGTFNRISLARELKQAAGWRLNKSVVDRFEPLAA